MSTFDDVDNEITDIKNECDDWVSSFTKIKFAGYVLTFTAGVFFAQGIYLATIGLAIAGLMLMLRKN